MANKLLDVGAPAPWFHAPCGEQPQFHFSSVAGRYVVLCFFHSAGQEPGRSLIEEFSRRRAAFDDVHQCFFGVSGDPEDLQERRVQDEVPGIRYFWDFDRAISRTFATVRDDGRQVPATYVLDERLRVIAALPCEQPAADHVARVMSILDVLPPLPAGNLADVQAPVLVVPRIFELELCRALIAHYDQLGGEESGFMREVDGKTVAVTDYGFKRRRDQAILDEGLRNAAMFRIHDRLAPEIHKAFQFKATRIERHIVACYDAATQGHFRAHRDNTTKGTLHRRFAVSLNLNTGEYEGGYLRFPEFGGQLYQAPAGGAVVFSCSLLHEATPITLGRRYAYLPFLYDEEAARIREMNRQYLA